MSEAIICPVCNGRFDEPGSVMCARRHVTPAQFDRLRAAETAAFRRGVEAMRKAARAEMNRLYFAEAEPTQQAYDRQDAFHCADRAIAALPPPEDKV